MPDATGSLLVNPFRRADGSLVRTRAEWPAQRDAWRDLIVDLEYGGLPPTPARTQHEILHDTEVRGQPGVKFLTLRVVTGPERPFSFLLNVHIPPGPGPFPVLLNGDGCWRYANDAVIATVLGRGCILAHFNRCELAPDTGSAARSSGLYAVYPEGQFGALSAWAWGYHRCVDVLSTLRQVDAARIAIAGHSRGGKTVLLAGATDERIALTCANNSGGGGAGSFHCQGPGSETLADLLRVFPYWFGPRAQAYAQTIADLPFDQHCLKAAIAPRALLTTEALGDVWANPSGTWQTHCAARAVYRFLGAADRQGIWFREGGHDHGLADWTACLDFMGQLWQHRAPLTGLNVNPFPDLPLAFTWQAPA